MNIEFGREYKTRSGGTGVVFDTLKDVLFGRYSPLPPGVVLQSTWEPATWDNFGHGRGQMLVSRNRERDLILDDAGPIEMTVHYEISTTYKGAMEALANDVLTQITTLDEAKALFESGKQICSEMELKKVTVSKETLLTYGDKI